MGNPDRDKIAGEIEKKFAFLFDQLNIKDSAKLVKQYVKEVKVSKKLRRSEDSTHDKKAEAFEGDD
jgi:hypothetical protein